MTAKKLASGVKKVEYICKYAQQCSEPMSTLQDAYDSYVAEFGEEEDDYLEFYQVERIECEVKTVVQPVKQVQEI